LDASPPAEATERHPIIIALSQLDGALLSCRHLEIAKCAALDAERIAILGVNECVGTILLQKAAALHGQSPVAIAHVSDARHPGLDLLDHPPNHSQSQVICQPARQIRAGRAVLISSPAFGDDPLRGLCSGVELRGLAIEAGRASGSVRDSVTPHQIARGLR
jgi:hypothetical protein